MLARRSFLVGALSTLAAACSSSGGDAPAGGQPRVVSISPSTTEAVFALGRGSWLVGRSTFCDEPAAALAVPEIGGFADPSLERIVALAPTLVIGERGPAGPRLVEALEQRGIATYFPPIATVADIEAFLQGLGERLDARAAADAAVRDVRARRDAVTSAVANLSRPRVLFLFDFKPIVAAGPGSFPDELVSIAGGANVVIDGGMYPRLSAEGVLALDPDLIIDGSAGAYTESSAQLLRGIAGLESLRALREGRVMRLEGTAALRPGPRIGKGLLQLKALIDGARGVPSPAAVESASTPAAAPTER